MLQRDTGWINLFFSDKFKPFLSDIPFLNADMDMQMITRMFRGFSMPPYTLGILTQKFGSFTEHNPMPNKETDGLTQTISLEIALSENMKNYFVFYNWIHRIRNGMYEGSSKDYKIKEFSIQFLDNQHRPTSTIAFRHLLIENIAEIPVRYGASKEVTFRVTFKYDEIDFDGKDMMAWLNSI